MQRTERKSNGKSEYKRTKEIMDLFKKMELLQTGAGLLL